MTHDLESLIGIAQVGGESHLYPPLNYFRLALGVEGDEVERRARLPCGIVVSTRTVLQKLLKVVCGLCVTRAGCRRAAYSGFGQGAPHAIYRIVIKAVVFLRSTAPVADVGLIPNLPVPRLRLGLAVAQNAMQGQLVDQLAPLLEFFGRIGPAHVKLDLSASGDDTARDGSTSPPA